MHNLKCDICGWGEHLNFFDRGRGGESISVVACTNCGFVFLNPRPGVSEIRNFYRDGNFSLEARGGTKPSVEKISQSENSAFVRFKNLDDVLNVRTFMKGNCLEIGCGLGSFLRLINGLNCNVTGLEPDPHYASFGKEIYRINIENKIYEEFEAGAVSYDLIATFHVLEHVDSPRRFLEKIFSELKDDGFLYLEVPCINRPCGGDLTRFFWSSHLYYFSSNTIVYLLKTVGFEIIKVGYFGDFLWVICKKNKSRLNSEAQFPLDKPAKLLRKLNQEQCMYRVKKLRISRYVQRTAKFFKDVAYKGVMDPKTVFFGISNSLNLFPLQKIWTTRKKKIIHIGLHRPTNAGDTLLFSSVRKLIGSVLNDRWQLEPLRTTVTSAKIEDWNEIGKAVVVGGGGLFLKDTNPNDVSGWQWPCGVRDLAKLRTPLILFAVGYNRFRGQEEFSNVFRENIVELVCRAKFVGLRNQGSIANLKSYLPEHLWQKLVFQPCPTTILKYMDKRIELNRSLKRCRIGLNLAFDRHNLRFRGREFEILDDIAKAMKWAQQNNWKIDLISHMPLDATVAPWLIRHGVVYEEVNLFGVSADKVIEYYRDLPITIGMRGHSQMVPFGVGNAIISLVSHDKLAWFLEDIQHPEWGIEINKPGLEGSLKEKIQYVGGNLLRIRKEIELSQALLWSVTHNNLQTVKGLVEGTEELS